MRRPQKRRALGHGLFGLFVNSPLVRKVISYRIQWQHFCNTFFTVFIVVVLVLLYYDKEYFVPPQMISFVNSGSCSALIVAILQPSKQLFSPQIKKYYHKANNAKLQTSGFEVFMKRSQQSMKLWWTTGNAANVCGYLFILRGVQTGMTTTKPWQVSQTSHEPSAWCRLLRARSRLYTRPLHMHRRAFSPTCT